ncbi:6-phospho-3-hexuloisomerase [Bacillus sp. KH172YL63]|uniref:6-phospho-3-hexuloisomerase n=1 Tax=Bacillus sp. KH172YL63 TaxID=2709784 RepID=UPI0013E516F3|nr:6-phospho-3-hexuloisomerase [Bacillus sp. KH172YL63]BCB04642.1 3-hexulose-6-phosphate isomerase [Bacillus sp. KH172YL63]
MITTQYILKILQELNRTADAISNDETERLVNGILEANKVFVAGAGRSGLMTKSFAMRLMHMGIDAYVIGETVTPSFKEEDMVIIASGSGETKSLVSIADKAKSIGGKIAAVTIFPESTIGQSADMVVRIPGAPKDQSAGDYQTIQPMGSAFEQFSLVLFDSIILRCMEKKGLDTANMYGNHANLE